MTFSHLRHTPFSNRPRFTQSYLTLTFLFLLTLSTNPTFALRQRLSHSSLASLNLDLSSSVQHVQQFHNPSKSAIGRTKSTSDSTVNPRFKNPSIIGGIRATEAFIQRSALVLVSTPQDTFRCTGSILNANTILTAAHCFFDLSQSTPMFDVTYAFIAPAQSSAKVSAVYIVKHVDIHRRFNSQTLQNDLAILTVTGVFNSNLNFRSIVLPRRRIRTPTDTLGQTCGFGRIRDNARLAKVLRQTTLKIRPVRECRRKFDRSIWNTILRNEVLCTTDEEYPQNPKGSDAFCDGDSGAPLFMRDPKLGLIQIGIASFTEDTCSSPGATSWFTNVKNYVQDIKANLNGNTTAWERKLSISL